MYKSSRYVVVVVIDVLLMIRWLFLQGTFHSHGQGDQTTTLMNQKDDFAYGEDSTLNIRALSLPYKGNDASFYVFLPKSSGVEALETVEKSLTSESLDKVIKGMTVQNVEVTIPKFKVEKTLELKKILAAVGMDLPFGSSADFSGMTGDT